MLLGLVRGVGSSLKCRRFRNPLRKVAMSRHMALLREKKKLIARTVHMRSLEDVRVHQCSMPVYSSPSPFDHQNLTLRFVAGWKVMAVVWGGTL